MTEVHDIRFLQSSEEIPLSSSEILRATCKIYGSLFLVLFVIFLVVRVRYPKVYNIKNSYNNLKTPIAENPFGLFSWMWNVFKISYNDIVEQCGMDAATTIRLLESGVKLSVVGVVCSAFLFPAYNFDTTLESEGIVSDPLDSLSLSNVPSGSHAAIATTVGAYILFGAAMFFIARDLEWYQEHRRKFLSKKEASNYSIYMSGLPVEYRSDGAVKQHFVEQNAHVFEARVALQIPNLEKHAMMRQSVVDKLEHAINVQYVKGVTPKHRTKMCGGKMVMSIPEYNKELVELNSKISSEIDNITYVHQTRDGEDPTLKEAEREPSVKDEDEVKASEHVDGKKQSVAAGFVSSIKSLVYSEDGSARNAAFISFSDLTSTNLALQACHHHKPWVCEVQPAPKPEQVEWKNVGTSNKSKQIGELLSLALTVILCLFWTIPVGFVASLSNVESLTELLPFLKPVVENNPWFGQLLAQLAPLILVGFISMLPYILLAFVGLEKSICLASLQSPSLFNKVAWFTIIQTFFVSTLSGSVTSELQKISENPSYAVELMAKALPSQASYFIQVILVQNFLGLGTELLRVSPVAQAVIRHYAAKMTGYDLTEKEMNTTIMGLRVYSDPLEYYFGSKLGGETILIFMVLFVYGTMSPITCYFTLLVFFILAMGFRNQFIYIYPIANDSGGTLFTCFIKTIIVCMIIAQVILIGVVGLKQSPIATALLIPLLISTFLFQWYLNKRHYAVTRCLPLEDCSKIDRENEREGMILDFLKEAYLQPAIKTKFAFPENHDKIIETGETNSRDPLSSVESTSP